MCVCFFNSSFLLQECARSTAASPLRIWTASCRSTSAGQGCWGGDPGGGRSESQDPRSCGRIPRRRKSCRVSPCGRTRTLLRGPCGYGTPGSNAEWRPCRTVRTCTVSLLKKDTEDKLLLQDRGEWNSNSVFVPVEQVKRLTFFTLQELKAGVVVSLNYCSEVYQCITRLWPYHLSLLCTVKPRWW